MAKYRVVLIEEGLGNLNDLFYYTKEALEYAATNKVFEGAQAFADHPSKMEEAIRPERSIRDIVGYYDDVHVEEGENGCALLIANLHTLDSEENEWTNALIETALKVSGKFDSELLGLSINAAGNSEKKSIDDLLADENLPLGAKPKLLKAREQGAMEVEYCTELAEAVSCDLVTKAGARGRALKKLVESERNRMSKKVKENDKKEMEKKQSEKHQSEKHENEGEKHEDAGHDDEDQDKELIKSMIKKHLGDGDHPEEVHQAMKQAYEQAKEMGMEGEAAQEAAGMHMKMSKHAAEKKQKAEAEKHEAEESEKHESSFQDKKDGDMDSMKQKKESAEVDSLRKEVREMKLEKFLDHTIKQSGFGTEAVKKFRESLGTPTSEEQIKKQAKMFKEAMELGSSGTTFINPEKSNQSEGTFSLADCVRE